MAERSVTAPESGVIAERKKQLRVPPMYKVLLHNDDYTTMEFVVQVLESVFRMSPGEATQVMLSIHRTGVGIAGVYSHEVAETKAAVVEALARQREFPLKCSLEEA